MEKEEFITYWLRDISNKPHCPDRAYFDEHYLVLPCECGKEKCKGWAAIFNHPLMIDHHNRTNNPETRGKSRP